MKVLIIEDEYLASSRLKRLIQEIDLKIKVLSTLQSVEDSINWLLKNEQPDLIFLDIQLDDGLCFEIFEKIDIDIPIIFITAFDEYAIKAFKVNSVDYLLKPIEKEELSKSIEKFIKYHENNYNLKIEKIISSLEPQNKQRFLVKVGEHYRSVQTNDINCFYVEERCNFIFTSDGKSYAIDYSLDRLESLVDENVFFRVNRNFLININALKDIISFSSNRLKIILDNRISKEDILVSRDRVREFKNWIDR